WTLSSRRTEAYPSQLFRNDGDGTFTEIGRRAGVTNDRFAEGVAWGDYDDDGDPDLYVSNLGPNRLYRNDGLDEDGTVRFTDVAPELGVDEPSAESFGTWFFDFDNDGDLDLWVNRYGARMEHVSASYLGHEVPGHHPVLYRNDGGRFNDVSEEVRLTRPSLPMGANHGDLDNDGFPDVYLGTGIPDPDATMPNVLYRNDSGKRFLDVTFAGGFGHLQKGHGVAFGDLDNDGDVDLFHQMGGAFPFDDFGNVLFENPGPARSWITLRLVGREANRFGVGGRIEVRVRRGEERRSVHALVGTGGSFGASSLQQEIGLGDAEAIEEIVVHWPGSGTRQVFEDVALNRYYRLTEGEDRLVPLELAPFRLGSATGDPDAEPAEGSDHEHHRDHHAHEPPP
ncbi:MAG: CRTAC1 family protein, partial [Thermoanaerobaculia bacterium]